MNNTYTEVTAENLVSVRETLPLDMGREIAPGCEVWASGAGDERCTVATWPSERRAAICWNGDSSWGDYTGGRGGDLADFRLTLESGEVFNAQGREITPWRSVPLCEGRSADDARDIGANDPRRIELLSEYRTSGSMHLGWLCDTDTLARLSGDDALDYGPKPNQIDWTGFPSVSA